MPIRFVVVIGDQEETFDQLGDRAGKPYHEDTRGMALLLEMIGEVHG
jgi:hypothetical protein